MRINPFQNLIKNAFPQPQRFTTHFHINEVQDQIRKTFLPQQTYIL